MKTYYAVINNTWTAFHTLPIEKKHKTTRTQCKIQTLFRCCVCQTLKLSTRPHTNASKICCKKTKTLLFIQAQMPIRNRNKLIVASIYRDEYKEATTTINQWKCCTKVRQTFLDHIQKSIQTKSTNWRNQKSENKL